MPHGTDQVSALPFLTPDSLRVSGELKVAPEDFLVEEIAAYEPNGEGEHLFLWIEKRDVSADHLAGHLARALQIRRDDIGMAGLKDRRAVTRQWVSVPAEAEDRVESVSTDEIQVLQRARHTNKLKTGHLRGNRFEILLRTDSQATPSAPVNSLDTALKIVELISAQGVPNYFGEQRFGIEQETLQLGLKLLAGMSPGEIPYKRRKFLLRLAVSSVQSWLFNQVLSRRLSSGWLGQVQSGDVMQVTQSGGLFLVEEVDIEQQRFAAGETVVTGPLFGPKMKQPADTPLELEQAVLRDAELTSDSFRQYKKLTPGGRRPLVLRPDDLSVTEEAAGLRFRFSLPSGAYATVLLREFLKHTSASGSESD